MVRMSCRVQILRAWVRENHDWCDKRSLQTPHCFCPLEATPVLSNCDTSISPTLSRCLRGGGWSGTKGECLRQLLGLCSSRRFVYSPPVDVVDLPLGKAGQRPKGGTKKQLSLFDFDYLLSLSANESVLAIFGSIHWRLRWFSAMWSSPAPPKTEPTTCWLCS